MELKDIQAYLETNKDVDEVKNYLLGLSKPTPEGVTSFLDSEDGKKILQPRLDSYFTKGLETWKGNNLSKLLTEEVDKEIKKRYPDTDPKDLKMKELEIKLEQMQKETLKKELTNNALKIATDKKLPVDLIEYLIGENDEATVKNLEKLEQVFSKHVDVMVQERIKSGSYTPPGGGGTITDDEKKVAEEFSKSLNGL